MPKLTALEVKNLRLPGMHGDGNGLYLNIAKGGSKSWIQRITVDGKRRDLGLGGYPAVSLAEARKLAAENRSGQKAQGKVERAKRVRIQQSTAPTFKGAATAFFELNKGRLRNEKNRRNWWQRAEKYIFPVIGDTPIDVISRADVLGILTPVWTAKPETGRKLREIMKSVFAWAQAYGYIEINNAGEIVNAALPAQPKIRNHYEALPYCQVPGALQQVEESTAYESTKLAFRFMVLTAARSGEVRGATWEEIDLERATWTIPAGRMKARREHRIPLSDAALEVLSRARRDSSYLFPNDQTPDKPLSDNALTYMLRRLDIRAVAHGFRSSFRDWAAEESDANFAVMELALAHGVGNAVVQSYARSDLLERRRCLMQQWADYLGRV